MNIRHRRYATPVMVLLLAFSIGATSVDARVVDEREKGITIEFGKSEFERVLANNHYENDIQTFIIPKERKEDFLKFARLVEGGLGSLSPDALKGYSRISGISSISYILGSAEATHSTVSIRFSHKDTFEERAEAQKTLDSVEDYIVKNYSLKTTYDVLYAINDYITKNYNYNLTPGNDYDPYTLSDFITSKEGVCHVYTALAVELLSRFGIENRYILGKINNVQSENPYHAWLGIKLGGNWYNFDPTWNDPIGGSPTTQYLAVPNTYFASTGYPRDFYTDLDATTSHVVTDESYTYDENRGKYKQAVERKYLNEYWGTNSYNFVTKQLKFNFMDIDPSKEYTLEIEPKGSVYINIDNERIRINDIKHSEVLKHKVNKMNGLTIENNVIKLPITSKETVLTYDKAKGLADGYIVDPSLAYISPITDIVGTDFELYALSLFERGIVTGTTETNYSPNAFVTKGQLISILGREDGITDGKSLTDSRYSSYNSGSHFDHLKSNGVIPYKYLSRFKNGDSITRVEVANVVYNYLTEKGIKLNTKGVVPFRDKASFGISSDHTKALALKSVGIFDDNVDGNFSPNTKLTRGQLVSVIYKTLELVK